MNGVAVVARPGLPNRWEIQHPSGRILAVAYTARDAELCAAALGHQASAPAAVDGVVVERALEYLRPHLEAGTFAAPDWAIQLASILTGGDGCGAPVPPSAPVGAADDFVSHRDAWREALNLAVRNAKDADDARYWMHEVRAFDKAYAALAQPGDKP